MTKTVAVKPGGLSSLNLTEDTASFYRMHVALAAGDFDLLEKAPFLCV
jgi:hypothetical protein